MVTRDSSCDGSPRHLSCRHLWCDGLADLCPTRHTRRQKPLMSPFSGYGFSRDGFGPETAAKRLDERAVRRAADRAAVARAAPRKSGTSAPVAR